MRTEEPDKPLSRLVEEAGARFDLSPRDQDFLYRFIRENG
jgi:hypothetical protein